MDPMSKIFASHHPAWGRSDFWFRYELIYGRCRKTCGCFLLAESWKNFTIRLAQDLSLVVKNYCPGAESTVGSRTAASRLASTVAGKD